jgi:hypothetical protein
MKKADNFDATKWLVENYPTIKQKISFLIQVDIDIKH